MISNFRLLSLACILFCGCGQDIHRAKISSPDNSIGIWVATDLDGAIHYAIKVDDKPFISSSWLGLKAREVNLKDGFSIVGVTKNSVDEVWTQPWGENKEVHDRHNEMAVALENMAGVKLTLRFRAFDDGIGLRYEYTTPVDSITVTDEFTEFHFAKGGDSWSIPSNFDTYELLYRKLPIGQLTNANTPATFRSGEVYASIHEAALYDYPEMNLFQTDSLVFKTELAPLPDDTKAHLGSTFQTPWRTIQIAREAVGLINSSLILNLNEPCKIEDTSWIRPMKYVGVWWGMHLGTETWTMGPRHGATTSNAKRYIDFAAANNIEGVLFEGWNVGWENWGGNQRFEQAQPYPDFDMDAIVRYAAQKGVQVIGHHETGGNTPDYEQQMDNAFQWYASQGVHNLKTGYAGGMPFGNAHHNQFGVRHYQKVVETAAKHRLTLDVHEPIKETGIRRTWPNMMTREGARGKEWDAWSEGNPPSHEAMLAFTRMLSGPLDYTPGTFDILFEKTRNSPHRVKWNGNDQGNSRVNSTLAKQIADWVILYSPLQMASDLPEHYKGHPAFQFFRDFDADCDWSQALAGEPGEYVAIVRRAKDRYFLGAVTDEHPRTLQLPLGFLTPGTVYRATVYADAPAADWKDNPAAYTITEHDLTSTDTLDVWMAPGGGQAVTFIPAK